MGNKESFSKDDYYMHIQLIGIKMEKFYERIKNMKIPDKKIKNYWKFDYNEKVNNIKEEIDLYFDKLEERRKLYRENLRNKINDPSVDFREVLIFKIDNFCSENGKEKNEKSKELLSPDIDIIFNRLNKLNFTHFMPIVLLLSTNKNKLILNFDIYKNKYKYIDPRLILVSYYNEESLYIDAIIDKMLLRFCSIHNELGDRFSIKDPNFTCDYDLIEEYFPFNLNIACIGRFGQGKSTGVNCLLGEYKAKESSKGNSQTKQLTYYQVRNQPVRILDIPGFNDEKTIKDAVDKFKFCREEINRLKDNIHIILYFINYLEIRKFEGSEIPILEEIKKHKSSKLIYVITHSCEDMDELDKEVVIDSLKEGLNSIIQDEENILEPSQDNVVFVNFHYDSKAKFQPFGEKELFKKIHDTFTNSNEYKNSLKEKLTKEEIENRALKLREEAKSSLLSNKIFGAAIGAIPGVDWLVQKFLIKKNAVKKIGEKFGIDVKFIDESNKQNDAKQDKNTNLTKEIDGDELVNGTALDNIKEAVKAAGEAGIYINGGHKIVKGIRIFDELTEFSRVVTETVTELRSIEQFALEKANSVTFLQNLFTNTYEVATGLAEKAAQYAEEGIEVVKKANDYKNGALVLQTTGRGMAIIGCVIGVALGGYFTHSFCEETLDKFVDYYKKNAEKLSNSYENAAKYFKNKY